MVQTAEKAINYCMIGRGSRQIEITSSGEIVLLEEHRRTVVGIVGEDGLVSWPMGSQTPLFREIASMLILHACMPQALEVEPAGDRAFPQQDGPPARAYHRLLQD